MLGEQPHRSKGSAASRDPQARARSPHNRSLHSQPSTTWPAGSVTNKESKNNNMHVRLLICHQRRRTWSKKSSTISLSGSVYLRSTRVWSRNSMSLCSPRRDWHRSIIFPANINYYIVNPWWICYESNKTFNTTLSAISKWILHISARKSKTKELSTAHQDIHAGK